MTQLLEQVFSEASQLPELQQNMLAQWLMDEVLTEKKWAVLFAETADGLAALADEAVREYQQGKTQVLDADAL